MFSLSADWKTKDQMLPEDSHLAPCSNKSRPVLSMFNVCVCWIWKVAAVGKRLSKKWGIFRVKITSNVWEIHHWMWANFWLNWWNVLWSQKWLYSSLSTFFYEWSVIRSENDIIEEIVIHTSLINMISAFMDCVSLFTCQKHTHVHFVSLWGLSLTFNCSLP